MCVCVCAHWKGRRGGFGGCSEKGRERNDRTRCRLVEPFATCVRVCPAPTMAAMLPGLVKTSLAASSLRGRQNNTPIFANGRLRKKEYVHNIMCAWSYNNNITRSTKRLWPNITASSAHPDYPPEKTGFLLIILFCRSSVDKRDFFSTAYHTATATMRFRRILRQATPFWLMTIRETTIRPRNTDC